MEGQSLFDATSRNELEASCGSFANRKIDLWLPCRVHDQRSSRPQSGVGGSRSPNLTKSKEIITGCVDLCNHEFTVQVSVKKLLQKVPSSAMGLSS